MSDFKNKLNDYAEKKDRLLKHAVYSEDNRLKVLVSELIESSNTALFYVLNKQIEDDFNKAKNGDPLMHHIAAEYAYQQNKKINPTKALLKRVDQEIEFWKKLNIEINE